MEFMRAFEDINTVSLVYTWESKFIGIATKGLLK